MKHHAGATCATAVAARKSRRKFLFATAIISVAATGLSAANWGNWGAPVNIEDLPDSSTEINTASIDGCASISPDGLTLAFNSFRTGNQDIYLATRSNTSEGFGDPVLLPATINKLAPEFCPTLTHGKRMYFSRPSLVPADPGDLFVSQLGPNGWSEAQRLGPAVNNTGTAEMSASFYEDDEGREVLVFSRQPVGPFVTPGGKIYQSINGAPATLVTGGPHSSFSDNRPSVTHDGRTIFWDSDRTGTLGGPDYWYAIRSNTSQPWGQAIHLPQLSSAEADTRPYVSWRGDMMIISSASDIYFANRTKTRAN